MSLGALKMDVNPEREEDVLSIIHAVAEIEDLMPNEEEVGRKCYAFSEKEDEAFAVVMAMVRDLFAEYALSEGEDYKIEEDAIGNLFVTFYGENREEAILCGSHLDSVTNGGMYDGVAGVNASFNFLRKLVRGKDNGAKQPSHSYVFAAFRAEESSPTTGVTCVGSSIATGKMEKEKLSAMNYNYFDENGTRRTVKFKDYLTRRYGPERWEAILAELDNPIIKPEKVKFAFEMHIEQSAVLEMNDADVGIVVMGIGGAIREEANFVLENGKHLKSAEIGLNNPHKKFIVNISGEEAHTGGTPPNPTYNHDASRGATVWYRKDALVAAARYTERLCRLFPEVKITKFGVPGKTGFTTVPYAQTLEFYLPENEMERFCKMKEDLDAQIDETDCEFRYAEERRLSEAKIEMETGAITYFDPDFVRNFMKIPLQTESAARSMVNQERKLAETENRPELAAGTVRATVTDFTLENGSLTFNLDYRDVNPVAIKKLHGQIRSNVSKALQNLDGKIETVCQGGYAPADEFAVGVQRYVAAEVLGEAAKVYLMPSLPGHDSKALQKAGIPYSFTFIRHPGISHNPHERMREENYVVAESVMHATMEQALNL